MGKRELYEISLPREQYVILLPATQGQHDNPQEFKRYTMYACGAQKLHPIVNFLYMNVILR